MKPFSENFDVCMLPTYANETTLPHLIYWSSALSTLSFFKTEDELDLALDLRYCHNCARHWSWSRLSSISNNLRLRLENESEWLIRFWRPDFTTVNTKTLIDAWITGLEIIERECMKQLPVVFTRPLPSAMAEQFAEGALHHLRNLDKLRAPE